MIRAGEVAEALARDAKGVARELLPQGKEKSGEWCAGSVGGEPGESLKVRLSGPKAGRWCDFADDGQRGDLLDLWAACRGVGIDEALREASDYLGIRQPEFAGTTPSQPKLKPPKGAQKATQDEDALTWLRHERELSTEAASAYRLAAVDGAVAFPAFTPEGSIQYIKYRSPTEKKFWSAKGGVPCLFGWQAIPSQARSVVICEGEMDALAWFDYGYPALSVTNGAGNTQWIDAEYDRLARFDTIYLSLDNDEAGQKSLGEVVERLGADRCLVVSLPEKDANECLMQGREHDEIDQAISQARSMDPEELVPASRFVDDVIAEFYPAETSDPGVRLPWKKCNERIVLRPGEVSLLAGTNGHGKSQAAGHIALQALSDDVRTCVASMEFKPQKWLKRLTQQAVGIREPATQYIRDVADWYDGRLWAFCATGTAKASRIIEVFRYAVRRYGIRYFVVDNLAKCGFDEDDYNGQKWFVDQLTDFARDHDAHVQICVHMRKGESEDKPADKMDIKGTGAITDMVDTVLVIWRNKPKEEKRRKHASQAHVAQQAGESVETFDESEEVDAVIKCVKQRNGDHEPTLGLWFCHESNQFLENFGDRPKTYGPKPSNGRKYETTIEDEAARYI